MLTNSHPADSWILTILQSELGQALLNNPAVKLFWRKLSLLSALDYCLLFTPITSRISGVLWHFWIYSPICGRFLPEYTWPWGRALGWSVGARTLAVSLHHSCCCWSSTEWVAKRVGYNCGSICQHHCWRTGKSNEEKETEVTSLKCHVRQKTTIRPPQSRVSMLGLSNFKKMRDKDKSRWQTGEVTKSTDARLRTSFLCSTIIITNK